MEHCGLSRAEVGVLLVPDGATVAGIADRLESARLGKRRPDPDGDRCINRVFVTA